MMRTVLATVIGATIALGALVGCNAAAGETTITQAPTAQGVGFTTPVVAPAPLPDIKAVAKRADAERQEAEATQQAARDREASAKLPAGELCIGYECSAEQDAEILAGEVAANAGEDIIGSTPDGSMTSGETQYEYGCSEGYITEGC